MKKLIVFIFLISSISVFALTKDEALKLERETFYNLRSRENGQAKRELVMRLDKIRENINNDVLDTVEKDLEDINNDINELKKDTSFIKRLGLSVLITTILSFFVIKNKKSQNLHQQF